MLRLLPRYMWRNVHTLSCKSLACISWAGGCMEKSYRRMWVHLIPIAKKMLKIMWLKSSHTRGGNIFSAARRGTEKPPWVLVSLAVSVLQKNSDWGLGCLRAISDSCNASFPYWSLSQFEIQRLGFKWLKGNEGNIYSKPGVALDTYWSNWQESHLRIHFICFWIRLWERRINTFSINNQTENN